MNQQRISPAKRTGLQEKKTYHNLCTMRSQSRNVFQTQLFEFLLSDLIKYKYQSFFSFIENTWWKIYTSDGKHKAQQNTQMIQT